MVSSQMHWSLVIQRTEESIRFSLELNWINLSRFSSRTSLPIWEKNGQAVHVHVQYTVLFCFFSWKWPLLDFCALTKKDLHMHCWSNGIFFSLFLSKYRFSLDQPTPDMLLLSQAILQEWDQPGNGECLSDTQLTNTKLPEQFIF